MVCGTDGSCGNRLHAVRGRWNVEGERQRALGCDGLPEAVEQIFASVGIAGWMP